MDLARSYQTTSDPIEQIALAVCEVFSLSVDRVDNMSKWEFVLRSKYVGWISNRIVKRPWYMRRMLCTDAEQITLGQFIEIQHWLKMGEVESLPYVAASILRNRGNHKKDVERLMRTNVRRLLSDVKMFMESFGKLLESYATLFYKDTSLPIDPSDDEINDLDREKELETHPFIDQYGWIFSAKQVANFEAITLEQAYGLPIIQALNDLSYLKSEQDYQKQLNK